MSSVNSMVFAFALIGTQTASFAAFTFVFIFAPMVCPFDSMAFAFAFAFALIQFAAFAFDFFPMEHHSLCVYILLHLLTHSHACCILRLKAKISYMRYAV